MKGTDDSCSSVAGDSCSSVAGSPVAGSSADDDTHTVCVPYYKAAPYNISHTKIFQWRFSL